MDRNHKIIASLVSIIPTVIASLFAIFERLHMSVRVPVYIDVFIVGINIAWWFVIALFNYIIWKGKLILVKNNDK